MDRRNIHPTAKRLLLIRGLRSIGQGAMVVDLTLYLQRLHWSGAAIGGVTSAAGLVGAILILLVGILSDRLGRKPFLLIYETITAVAALAVSLTSHALILLLVIVIAGFGRGQSGAAGPFSPAEQAWLARVVHSSERGRVFSLNNAIGFIGMALGSVLGGVPSLLHGDSPLADYRPVFLMILVLSLVCVLVIALTREEKVSAVEPSPVAPSTSEVPAESETQIVRRENKSMLALALVNALNGIAVGLTGPMMAYWFSLRYGASAGEIGVTLSLAFLAAGLFSVVSGALATKIGLVKSVTWMRVIASMMLLALPWMPTFILASGLYVLRNAMARSTQGNRTALSASLTRDHRRGLATSVNALSMRLPSSIGPTITGYLFDQSALALPILLTAVLQLTSAGLYQWVFGRYDKQPIASS